MANQFKLIIFGEEWTVLLSDVDQHPILGEVSGYTDWTVKQIIIKDARKYQSKMDMDDQRAFMKSTLRHEIVHAALFESGLPDDRSYSHETIASWLEFKIERLYTTMATAQMKFAALLANTPTSSASQALL